MMKIRLLAALLLTWPAVGSTQTDDELVNDGRNTENVTTQSMGYDRKSYSPLKQINTSNVKRLVPIWSSSLMNDPGELAAPTVYNGVMYVINGKWTFAIDVETGRQIWRTPVDLDPGMKRERDHQRRGDDLQRQAVSRHHRQPRPRARHEDGQAGLEPEVRRLARRATTRQARPSSPTACSFQGWRAGNPPRAGFSTAGIPRPGRSCGAATPFRRPASLGPRRGRKTATPGSGAAGRRGAPVPTIPQLDLVYWGVGNAEPYDPAPSRGLSTACSPPACSRSVRRPAKSPATTSTRRMTSTT